MVFQPKRYSTLPEEEIFELYNKSRNTSLRNEIINRYTYVAEIAAKRFSGKGIDYDDLYQVGCLGLLYAAERFDTSKGVKFATFATPTVVGEIKRYFRDKGNFIRVPRRLYEIFSKADRIHNAANGEERPQPPVSVVSLDAENANDIVYEQVLGKSDDAFLMVEERDFIDRCMKTLNEKEREFIDLRYYKNKTQKEISSALDMSQMSVSRLERRVLGKIRDMYFDIDADGVN